MNFIGLKLIEVGGLEKQSRRVFEWQRSGNFVNDIVDVVERTGGRLSIDSFVGIASDALTISSDAEEVYVPGIGTGRDWEERRFRFFLEMELEPLTRYNKKRTRALIQGYTDHADLSHRDTVDPKMKMYINNVTTVQDFSDGARGTVTRVVDVSQTLLGDMSRGEDFLLRPSDVFARIENKEDAIADEMELDCMVDTRSSFHTGTQLNDRRSNASSNYLHKLVSSDLDAAANIDTRDMGIIQDNRDTLAYETAGGNIQTIRTNKFLRALSDSNRNFKFANNFHYADLADFSTGLRELDHLTDIIIPDGYGEFESQSWDGATAEVKAAAQICHLIPIIMIDCFMDSITFEVDNTDCRGDSADLIIEDFTSMLGENVRNREHLRAFETRVKREVFDQISNNGHMSVDMSVDSEMCGITIIEISIDGDSFERYVFPSFADGLLSPVVTNDAENAEDMAEGYIEVRKHVDEVVGRQRDISLSTDVGSAVRERDRRTPRSERRRSNDALLDDDILGNGSFKLANLDEL